MSNEEHEDEESEWNRAAHEGECCSCGQVAMVQVREDPFVREGIDEREGPDRPWCFFCYDTRCMDV